MADLSMPLLTRGNGHHHWLVACPRNRRCFTLASRGWPLVLQAPTCKRHDVFSIVFMLMWRSLQQVLFQSIWLWESHTESMGARRRWLAPAGKDPDMCEHCCSDVYFPLFSSVRHTPSFLTSTWEGWQNAAVVCGQRNHIFSGGELMTLKISVTREPVYVILDVFFKQSNQTFQILEQWFWRQLLPVQDRSEPLRSAAAGLCGLYQQGAPSTL